MFLLPLPVFALESYMSFKEPQKATRQSLLHHPLSQANAAWGRGWGGDGETSLGQPTVHPGSVVACATSVFQLSSRRQGKQRQTAGDGSAPVKTDAAGTSFCCLPPLSSSSSLSIGRTGSVRQQSAPPRSAPGRPSQRLGDMGEEPGAGGAPPTLVQLSSRSDGSGGHIHLWFPPAAGHLCLGGGAGCLQRACPVPRLHTH